MYTITILIIPKLCMISPCIDIQYTQQNEHLYKIPAGDKLRPVYYA